MIKTLLLLALSGTIRGHVTWAGKVETTAFKVGSDKRVCGESQPDESLLVDAHGGVANAVVFLQDAEAAPGPSADLKLDQSGCRFTPHVQAAHAGSSVTAINSDPALHTVHGAIAGKTTFNQAMPLQGMKKKFPLAEAGLTRVTCDAGHSWMTAWIYVFDHPYFAVTGKDGSFELRDVPPGEHTLAVWHERLGTTSQPAKTGSTIDVRLK